MSAPTTTDTTLTGRWTKQSGDWYIRTDQPARPGDPVVVVKANGDRVHRVLGDPGDDTGTLYRPAPDTPSSSSGTAPEVGLPYWNTDHEIVMVAVSDTTGNLYGKVWNGTKFEYRPRALADLVRPLTLDEARAFGAEYVRCCCCGRQLTNPTSKAAGIGPICAERF